MSENTTIEWCDSTWSPVWGCTQVSKAETGGGGCDNCYAMKLAHRFGTGWNGAPMREFGDDHWDKPVQWNKRAAKNGTRPKVFPSMCDPLDKDWPDALRERFWRLVDNTPHLTWLILTKRIGNAERLGPAAVIGRWPANVRLGATVVNQLEYDRDIGKLLRTPAAGHFLSVEPMLGAIDMRMGGASVPDYAEHRPLARLGWLICGGESGPGARPMHPDWARSLRDQCAAAGVAFLFKQHGEWLPTTFCTDAQADLPHKRLVYIRRDGTYHDGSEGINFFGGDEETAWIGKKAAGRLLDGVEHNGFPEAA